MRTIVLASGTLQGVLPSDEFTSGNMRVKLDMVEGVRPIRLKDLQNLAVRIGGVVADELNASAAWYLNITSFTKTSTHNNFFVSWPSKLFLASVLQIEENGEGPILYPILVEGRHLEIDGISFTTTPQIVGRNEPLPEWPVNTGGQEEVSFRTINFARFVEGCPSISMYQVLASILRENGNE